MKLLDMLQPEQDHSTQIKGPQEGDDPDCNIYFKNVDYEIPDEALREMFLQFGDVKNLHIVRDGKGRSRGFGFMSYFNTTDAQQAILELNGKFFGRKEMVVMLHVRKEERRMMKRLLLEQQEIEEADCKDLSVSSQGTDSQDLQPDNGTIQSNILDPLKAPVIQVSSGVHEIWKPPYDSDPRGHQNHQFGINGNERISATSNRPQPPNGAMHEQQWHLNEHSNSIHGKKQNRISSQSFIGTYNDPRQSSLELAPPQTSSSQNAHRNMTNNRQHGGMTASKLEAKDVVSFSSREIATDRFNELMRTRPLEAKKLSATTFGPQTTAWSPLNQFVPESQQRQLPDQFIPPSRGLGFGGPADPNPKGGGSLISSSTGGRVYDIQDGLRSGTVVSSRVGVVQFSPASSNFATGRSAEQKIWPPHSSPPMDTYGAESSSFMLGRNEVEVVPHSLAQIRQQQQQQQQQQVDAFAMPYWSFGDTAASISDQHQHNQHQFSKQQQQQQQQQQKQQHPQLSLGRDGAFSSLGFTSTRGVSTEAQRGEIRGGHDKSAVLQQHRQQQHQQRQQQHSLTLRGAEPSSSIAPDPLKKLIIKEKLREMVRERGDELVEKMTSILLGELPSRDLSSNNLSHLTTVTADVALEAFRAMHFN